MVGMLVNGHDPLASDRKPQAIPARKEKRHLIRLLEALAGRVEITREFAARSPDPGTTLSTALGNDLDRDYWEC